METLTKLHCLVSRYFMVLWIIFHENSWICKWPNLYIWIHITNKMAMFEFLFGTISVNLCSSQAKIWKYISNRNQKHHVCRGLCYKHFCKVSALSLSWLLRRWFLTIFFNNLVSRLPWQPIKFRHLDKDDKFHRRLLKEHFYKHFVKISAVS